MKLDKANFQYINLTEMCKQAGKRIGHYFVNGTTKAYLEVLSNRLAVEQSTLVRTKVGGVPSEQGTWGHPLVALKSNGVFKCIGFIIIGCFTFGT